MVGGTHGVTTFTCNMSDSSNIGDISNDPKLVASSVSLPAVSSPLDAGDSSLSSTLFPGQHSGPVVEDVVWVQMIG